MIEILTGEILQAIVIIGILAAAAEGLVELVIADLWERYGLDTFWLRYWAWGIAALLCFASGQLANAFATIIPNPWIGLILTAILAARGSNFLHDIYSGAEKRKG